MGRVFLIKTLPHIRRSEVPFPALARRVAVCQSGVALKKEEKTFSL